MNIKVHTRFNLGDEVFAHYEDEELLCTIDKVQYGIHKDKAGEIKESLSYRLSVVGSGRTFWVGGNQLIRKQ